MLMWACAAMPLLPTVSDEGALPIAHLGAKVGGHSKRGVLANCVGQQHANPTNVMYMRLQSDACFAADAGYHCLSYDCMQVTWGRGFALVKGLPVWRWTRRQSILAYWGIGLHWSVMHPGLCYPLPCVNFDADNNSLSHLHRVAGARLVQTMPKVKMHTGCLHYNRLPKPPGRIIGCRPVSACTADTELPPYMIMNFVGHLVGHIKDIGHDPRNPTTRLYATHEGQPWHNDISDLVCEYAVTHLTVTCTRTYTWPV